MWQSIIMRAALFEAKQHDTSSVKFILWINKDKERSRLSQLWVVYYVRSSVQKFPARHTKAAPNGKCSEGYIVPSMVRLMYQLKSVLK